MAKNVLGKFILCVFLLVGIPVFGQDLSLNPEDLHIELRADGGFHLFIRKKPDISSVLLTESTRDPAMGADNFAYRAKEWNSINGDEIRLLNGVPIPRESRIFSLVSSTPVLHPELGTVFHIYIPWILEYGYPPGRHGEVHVTDGTYFNIRAFNFPYADYRGRFHDNPFILSVVQRPPERPLGQFMPEAERAFNEIAREGRGDFLYAENPAALIEKIGDILKKEVGKAVDIVLCIDTTGSMRPYMDEIRAKLVPMMREITAEFTDWRIGMVRFKDYFEEYLTRVIPFTRNFNLFQQNLNAIRARGGGDIPEAVYEALYDAADQFPWEAESKLIILIGDAPPHPVPRGRITRDMVFQMAAEKDLKISAIILSQ
jgi:hypothetical protein